MGLRERVIAIVACATALLGLNHFIFSTPGCQLAAAAAKQAGVPVVSVAAATGAGAVATALANPPPRTLRSWNRPAVAPLHVAAPRHFLAIMTAASLSGNEALRLAREEEYRVGLEYFFDHFQTVCVSDEEAGRLAAKNHPVDRRTAWARIGMTLTLYCYPSLWCVTLLARWGLLFSCTTLVWSLNCCF